MTRQPTHKTTFEFDGATLNVVNPVTRPLGTVISVKVTPRFRALVQMHAALKEHRSTLNPNRRKPTQHERTLDSLTLDIVWDISIESGNDEGRDAQTAALALVNEVRTARVEAEKAKAFVERARAKYGEGDVFFAATVRHHQPAIDRDIRAGDLIAEVMDGPVTEYPIEQVIAL